MGTGDSRFKKMKNIFQSLKKTIFGYDQPFIPQCAK
jgi:hypothetical protein